MSDAVWRISRVEERARQIMGRSASVWMISPCRLLGRLTPHEVSASGDAGMQIVLTEIERAQVVLRKVGQEA